MTSTIFISHIVIDVKNREKKGKEKIKVKRVAPANKDGKEKRNLKNVKNIRISTTHGTITTCCKYGFLFLSLLQFALHYKVKHTFIS